MPDKRASSPPHCLNEDGQRSSGRVGRIIHLGAQGAKPITIYSQLPEPCLNRPGPISVLSVERSRNIDYRDRFAKRPPRCRTGRVSFQLQEFRKLSTSLESAVLVASNALICDCLSAFATSRPLISFNSSSRFGGTAPQIQSAVSCAEGKLSAQPSLRFSKNTCH